MYGRDRSPGRRRRVGPTRHNRRRPKASGWTRVESALAAGLMRRGENRVQKRWKSSTRPSDGGRSGIGGAPAAHKAKYVAGRFGWSTR